MAPLGSARDAETARASDGPGQGRAEVTSAGVLHNRHGRSHAPHGPHICQCDAAPRVYTLPFSDDGTDISGSDLVADDGSWAL